MATIEISNNGVVNPIVFKENEKYGAKVGDRIIIPAVYNRLDYYPGYGFIGRKGAYYYAFSKKGVPFVMEAAGIETYGQKGVIVYKDAARESIDSIVPWMF